MDNFYLVRGDELEEQEKEPKFELYAKVVIAGTQQVVFYVAGSSSVGKSSLLERYT